MYCSNTANSHCLKRPFYTLAISPYIETYNACCIFCPLQGTDGAGVIHYRVCSYDKSAFCILKLAYRLDKVAEVRHAGLVNLAVICQGNCNQFIKR